MSFILIPIHLPTQKASTTPRDRLPETSDGIVDETKQAMDQDQLEDSLYRSVVNAMSEGVLIHDHEGIIHACNPSSERLFGVPARYLVGHQLFEHNWHVIREDGSPYLLEDLPGMITLRTGAIFSNEIMGLYRPDGVLVWISVNTRPLMDTSNTLPHRVLITFTDVTERHALVQALSTSEKKFHNTFDHAAIGMALIGVDGRWLEVNPALCEIVGYSSSELFSKTFQEITHPDDLDMNLVHFNKLLSGEVDSYQTEKRYIHKQGQVVWTLLTVSTVRDSDGRVLYFVDQIQNISKRKEAEQALQLKIEQEHEFQTYLKALHEITVELTHVDDLDTFYKRAIELGLQRLGFERLGLLLYDPVRARATGTYGTDAQGRLKDERHFDLGPEYLTGILQRAYESETRFVVDEDAVLYDDLRPVGTGWNAVAVLWNGVEKLGWIAIDNVITHSPKKQNVLDILGLYALTLGTLLAQKRSQMALLDQRNLLQTLIDNLPEHIYVKDLQSRFILVNQAILRSVGISAEAILGKSDFDLHAPDLARTFFAEEQSLLKSGNTLREKEERVTYPNGQTVYLSTFKAPLRDSQGNVIGLVGTNHDVTERRQLQSALIDKEKLQTALAKELELSQLKTRMMERISHEFRTPLTIIQMSTETFMNYFDRLKPQQKESKITAIRQATRRLADMLNEIAVVVENRFVPENMKFIPINLRYTLEAIAYELETQGQLLGKFVLQVPDVIMMSADRDVIKDVLFQIMHNAVQYSAPRAPITVQYVDQASYFEIHVSDKGIGVMPDELVRIFQPFFRGSNIDEVGGLGVGLTIAVQGVEAHNGFLSVESELGQGTTVKIFLPKPPEED